MTLWEAIVLGLVQGLTEFLPISSSGHLVLGKYLLGIDPAGAANVTFEIFVHFGTVLSILTVYWSRVWEITGITMKALMRPSTLGDRFRNDEAFRIGVFIPVTMIPTGVAYILFGDFFEAAFGDPRLVCAMLAVTGVLLVLTMLRRDPSGELSTAKSFLIGVAQAAAMIPGISRSGATICTALYQNVKPEKAANFSFLMLLPVVVGATLLKGFDVASSEASVGWAPILAGTGVAYVSGVAAIKLLLDVIRRGRLQWFALYCFVAAAAGLIWI
jgi:undecaprenyl-diphosphatase